MLGRLADRPYIRRGAELQRAVRNAQQSFSAAAARTTVSTYQHLVWLHSKYCIVSQVIRSLLPIAQRLRSQTPAVK